MMTEPASAPARLNEERGSEPAPLDEAETAEQSVQSARNEEFTPIRVDGPAAAAVGGAADGPHDELLELVTSESRLVTTQLAKEIAELRRGQDDRAARIRKLSEALAEAQAALDHQEVWRAQAASERTAPVPDAPLEARIVDANPELGLVVIDHGARQGVRYGLPLTVLRNRQPVARIRVVDVRERVAGAAVEETARGDHPQTGDRAVLIRSTGP
ncbi:MAG: hypothetical protein PHO14_04745 [Kiritimatiellae bacterium]|nr:hypothetical protein [Kiritimatiellia bacterium]